jgi:hypothetical protein
MNDPVGHVGDDSVVGDDNREGAQLQVHSLDGLEHGNPSLHIQCAGGLIAEKDFRAFRDRACDGDTLLLTPDICDGKWSMRSVNSTSASAPSGFIGSCEISVISATFSFAVRLGMRL